MRAWRCSAKEASPAMCGRFARHRDRKSYARALGVPVEGLPDDAPAWKPAYNVCPGTEIPIVRQLPGGHASFARLLWGLVPNWAKDPKAGNRHVNARAETAAEKPSFRRLLQNRRCLVPADAYYEWKAVPGGKAPYCFRRVDGAPFFFAALWDAWQSFDGMQELETFVTFTVAPNRLAARVHERMPVIVRPEDHAAWLDPSLRDTSRIAHVLATYPDGELAAYPVDPAVSRPAASGAGLIEATGPALEDTTAR